MGEWEVWEEKYKKQEVGREIQEVGSGDNGKWAIWEGRYIGSRKWG